MLDSDFLQLLFSRALDLYLTRPQPLTLTVIPCILLLPIVILSLPLSDHYDFSDLFLLDSQLQAPVFKALPSFHCPLPTSLTTSLSVQLEFYGQL